LSIIGIISLTKTVTDKGSVGTGTVTFSVNADPSYISEQKLTVTGNLTIAFSNWPSSGTYGEVEIQLVNGGSATITWPTINWPIGGGRRRTLQPHGRGHILSSHAARLSGRRLLYPRRKNCYTAAWGQYPDSARRDASVLFWGMFDALTSGNFLGGDYLGAYKWLPFSCTLASPGVLSSPAHSFANADPVVVTSKFGGTLPTTAGSWAGVLTVASATTDTFTAGVNTTSTGDGMVRKIVEQSIPANVTASFSTSTLTLTLA
jgi:hypothetical protein